jgi:hypothetical protein
MFENTCRHIIASLLLGVVLLIATTASSRAATLGIAENSCASVTVTNSNGTLAIACNGASNVPLSCSLTPSTTSPALNQAVNLIASCTGGTGPYSFGSIASVTGGSCPLPQSTGGGSAVAVSAMQVGPCVYAVAGTDSVNATSAAQSADVAWTGAPSPVCAVSSTAGASVAPGTPVTLAAHCTNSPTGYSWSGGGIDCAMATCVVNPETTTTYSVTASNSAGTSAAVQVTVDVATGAGNTTSCPKAGYAEIELLEPYNGRMSTQSSVGFANNNAVVLVFTVPANKTSGYVRISFAEAGGSAIVRTVALSPNPCDWDPADAISGVYGVTSSGQFTAGVGGGGLQPGTIYYFNIKNADFTGTPSCYSGNCDVVTVFLGM